MPELEKQLVLHDFMCNQFGCTDARALLKQFDGLQQDFMEDGMSGFARTLALHRSPTDTIVTKQDLTRYDENIIAHSEILSMTDASGRTWKPFQYLALLFTERYLDLYFAGTDTLLTTLNDWREIWEKNHRAQEITPYSVDDIRTLAFQSATGSGKTLLLHAGILQYQHYLKEYKRHHQLNKIILVTPNESLSNQHLSELHASNIPARLFSDSAEPNLFARRGVMVDIIDLHKLDDKKGVKRVALEAFEENNLVLVDEGHLGSGGKVWRKRRKQLAKNGFTFEYSATFNQAVARNSVEKKQLRDGYGKSILFDYSYKFFYSDGYGKDYHISNLPNTEDNEINHRYLCACLLTFYQQCKIYRENHGSWQNYHLAAPLWVFLGKTVTNGKTNSAQETKSDIVNIVCFLARILHQPKQTITLIAQLLSEETGLCNDKGDDIFSQSFTYIATNPAQQIYKDICQMVFHTGGQLHVSHVTSVDEIQLSSGDAPPFGVINVGDTTGLYNRLIEKKEQGNGLFSGLFSLSKKAFGQSRFMGVDNNNSPINIVIGARKFISGWNCWRVSTMGLLHVGTSEGSEIIQIFGRGVRLKGYEFSLKRHSRMNTISPPPNSEQLKLLETLNIFGLKANYMDTFKKYLAQEGIKVERITFRLPTQKQFSDIKDLKIIKKTDDSGEFQYSAKRFELPCEHGQIDVVTLHRNKNLQSISSIRQPTNHNDELVESQKFELEHLKLINKKTVYQQVLARKKRYAWHNLCITQQDIDTLLVASNQTWYKLYIATEKLEPSGYSRVREWEKLAVELICEYANQYWRKQRNNWEHEHLEVADLNNSHLNDVEEYVLPWTRMRINSSLR